MRPKVSVVIPCYNYGKYIEQCILSVLVQRVNFPIEILIKDDNSTDNSFINALRMKSLYENDKFTFRVYKNESNLGEINNTKSLLEKAKGQYVAYLDADDYWISPNKLQIQVDFLDSNSDYSMCVTGYQILEGYKYEPTNDFSGWLTSKSVDSEGLASNNNVSSSSSRVFRNYNNLIKDYFYEFPFSDWPLNFELSLLGKICYIDIPTYVYRVHPNSLSGKESHISEEELNNLYEKRRAILKSIYDEHQNQKSHLNLS